MTKEPITDVWNYMGDNNIPPLKDFVSEALITLLAQVAPRSVPKLRNGEQRKTNYQIYELPHSHSLVQAEEQTMFGMYLIPCRTPTRGSFPLDETFFQINEVCHLTKCKSAVGKDICLRGFSMKTRYQDPYTTNSHFV